MPLSFFILCPKCGYNDTCPMARVHKAPKKGGTPLVSDNVERIVVASGGSSIAGKLFAAQDVATSPTLVVVPGWPGNPDDVLGLGAFLSRRGVNVVMFNPRGLYGSGGEATFAHTLEDIEAVVEWVRTQGPEHGINREPLFLGGYSYGGGLALAYASKDPTIRCLISIAGTDHAQMIRQIEGDQQFARLIREVLESTAAPEGPARFDVDLSLKELSESQAILGLRENAANLADRSLLLIGGWEDENVTVDHSLLPFYRELRRRGARDIDFLVFHDDHEFAEVRTEMSQAILDWIQSKSALPW
jgi:dipeptidyl aminopeptidase/acylaminoacyl peptidase